MFISATQRPDQPLHSAHCFADQVGTAIPLDTEAVVGAAAVAAADAAGWEMWRTHLMEQRKRKLSGM